jgi:hypothetical protein
VLRLHAAFNEVVVNVLIDAFDYVYRLSEGAHDVLETKYLIWVQNLASPPLEPLLNYLPTSNAIFPNAAGYFSEVLGWVYPYRPHVTLSFPPFSNYEVGTGNRVD